MTLVRVPLIAILVLIVLYLLSIITQVTPQPTPQMQKIADVSEVLLMWQAMDNASKPTTAQQTQKLGLTISEGGSFDPNDLCKRYNAAFRAAGVPNACTAVELFYAREEIAVVNFKRGEDLVASVDYGVDLSENYARLGLPEGKHVWQTALRVYKPYTGKGIGQTIVRNYEILLRASGAKSGDIQLLIASPDKKIMLPQAASAWEDFIAQLCIEWGATAVYFPKQPGHIGCWRYLP